MVKKKQQRTELIQIGCFHCDSRLIELIAFHSDDGSPIYRCKACGTLLYINPTQNKESKPIKKQDIKYLG